MRIDLSEKELLALRVMVWEASHALHKDGPPYAALLSAGELDKESALNLCRKLGMQEWVLTAGYARPIV